MSDAKKVVKKKVGKGVSPKKTAKLAKTKPTTVKKKVVKTPPSFHPDVIEACKRYGAANESVGKVEGSVELAKWARAAEAHSIMVTAQKHRQAYIAAAVKHCNVARSVVTMDCKAELMRQALRIAPEELPKDSVSAFYELHRAQDAALFVAGENEDATAAALAKVKKIGKALAAGDLTVRSLRAEFAEEFKAQRKARMKGKKRDGEETTLTALPVTERVDAEGLKSLVDQWIASGGGTVPVIKVTPEKTTAKGVETCLANEAFHDALAEACTAEGPLWILVDRGVMKTGDAEPINASAVDDKSARKFKRLNMRAPTAIRRN